MEQINNILSDTQEEKLLVVKDSDKGKMSSPLLIKVRENFGIFGGLSFIFGSTFTFFFYKVGIGFNAFLFTCIMVFLLSLIMKKLSIPIKRATIAYYVGTILLGISSMLTSSWILQFINVIGIMLLLDLSLLHQLYDDTKWNFARHFGRMLGLLLNCIATLYMPFKDFLEYLKNTKLFKNDKVRNIITGFAIAIPLLWIIIGLLSSADLLFGKMTHQLYTFIFSSNLFYVILMTVFAFLACYCIICGAVSRVGINDKANTTKKANASIAITVVSLLCIVYVIFCSLQILYLFANGLFVLPEEFTFAEYARRGFFELLTVTVINIVLMLICTSFFEESKIIRFFLTVMTACTYIMIGSAVYRMLLYIGAYNLTFLRLFVLLFLFIDSLVLGGVIISVFRKEFPLFMYCVTVVTVSYLIFSFAKPDYFIASYHISEKKELEYTDIVFLTEGLSLDAAPVLVPFFSQEFDKVEIPTDSNQNNYDYISEYDREDIVKFYYNNIIENEKEREIRDFNLSYYLAARSIKSQKK